MPIRFRCPSCNQVLSVSSRKAGHKVRCPACQSGLKIPSLETTTTPTPTEEPPVGSETVVENDLDSVVDRPVPEPVPTAADDSVVGDVPSEDVPPSTGAGLLPAVVAGSEDEDEEEFELRRPQTEFEEMDLTPMVDVTFLLLIFFMITASFTMQKAIAFPPPSPEEDGASVQPKQLEDFKDECVIVEIHEDNSISIDDERIPLDADLATMLAAKGKNEMLIDAHENSLHETVVRVVDAGNEVQMQRIRLGSRGG
ncbi:MAG: biopolymer transporter ExbD [Planctomycetota bacterium]|nr:biopolymer transporter ExbD [Planctomycetota bacterium]